MKCAIEQHFICQFFEVMTKMRLSNTFWTHSKFVLISCSHFIIFWINKVSIIGLQHSLEQYVEEGNYDKPFDLKQVPLSTEPLTSTKIKKSTLSVEEPVKKEEKEKASRQDIFARKLG